MVDFAQRYMRANVADGATEEIVTYSGNRRTTHAITVKSGCGSIEGKDRSAGGVERL